MKTDAKISKCEKYRYSLERIWDENKSLVAFIALNPSTADEVNNDKTIKRCIDFAKSWGVGGMYMFNVFAYRATDPTDMKAQEYPIGSENDKFLAKLPNVDKIIVCWGNDGLHRDRANQVREILKNTEQNKLYCLDINKNGEPKHPLYVHGSTKPTLYEYPPTTFIEHDIS